MQVKNHVDIMEALDLIDFDSASEVSGSKFYYLRNAAALLEMALVNVTMQVWPWPCARPAHAPWRAACLGPTRCDGQKGPDRVDAPP